MNVLLLKILQFFVFVTIKVEILFGLSPTTFRSSNNWVSAFFSGLVKLAAVSTYPVACAKILVFVIDANSKTTIFARNLLLACNWVLILIIYANETTSFHQKYSKVLKLFRNLIKTQSLKQNFTFMLRWISKGLIIGTTLLFINFMKFSKRLKPEFSSGWPKCCIILVLLPFMVFTLVLNRVYMTNLVIKNSLSRIVEDLQSVNKKSARKIEICAIKYRILHEYFVAFNETNSVTFLTIICFSIVNIVYEVFLLKLFLSINT